MNELITVSISTFENRIINALELSKSFLNYGFNVLIVHQSNKAYDGDMCGVNYIHTQTKGVTKSRNIAINNVKTKYMWFMDDDITIVDEDIKRVGYIVGENNDNTLIFRVVDEYGCLRKRYKKGGFNNNKFSILNTGTIEILVDVEFIKNNGVLFPEDLGAGASLPLGDESVFLSRILERNGKIISIECSPITHPKESSGLKWTESHFLAKKKSFNYIFGRCGWLLFFIFCLYKYKKIKERELKIRSLVF